MRSNVHVPLLYLLLSSCLSKYQAAASAVVFYVYLRIKHRGPSRYEPNANVGEFPRGWVDVKRLHLVSRIVFDSNSSRTLWLFGFVRVG